MILNMHIRKDFDRWIEAPRKRVVTLCGKTTTVKYAGIPGITMGQKPLVTKAGDVGWCVRCCNMFLENYDNNDFMWTVKLSNEHLYALYHEMQRQTSLQVRWFWESHVEKST